MPTTFFGCNMETYPYGNNPSFPVHADVALERTGFGTYGSHSH